VPRRTRHRARPGWAARCVFHPQPPGAHRQRRGLATGLPGADRHRPGSPVAGPAALVRPRQPAAPADAGRARATARALRCPLDDAGHAPLGPHHDRPSARRPRARGPRHAARPAGVGHPGAGRWRAALPGRAAHAHPVATVHPAAHLPESGLRLQRFTLRGLPPKAREVLRLRGPQFATDAGPVLEAELATPAGTVHLRSPAHWQP
jgi:hypothetical protein